MPMNCYKGSSVTCIQEVLWCAKEGLSLYHLAHKRVYPAAVIVHWQLKLVDDIIKKGYLYRTMK